MLFKFASIISVGTELLLGTITDTNTAFVGRRLALLGIRQSYRRVVESSESCIISAFHEAVEGNDLVIVCGGLGPAPDDATRDAVAKAIGRELVPDKSCAERIVEYLGRHGNRASENDLRQACFPHGAKILKNTVGTANGCIIEGDETDKVAILLPGKPRELAAMWQQVEEYLLDKRRGTYYTQTLNFVGVSEAKVAQIVRSLELQGDSRVACVGDRGDIGLRVTSYGEDEGEAKRLNAANLAIIQASRLGKHCYGIDSSVERTVVDKLAAAGKTVGTAESCTGGLLSKMLTDCPGSSAVFPGGLTTYSNAVKQNLLGVRSTTLESYGAVSHQTAIQMAQGARRLLGTDYGLSVTGVAGPDKSENKPVGLIYIGLSDGTKKNVTKFELDGSREQIRILAARYALKQLLLQLL